MKKNIILKSFCFALWLIVHFPVAAQDIRYREITGIDYYHQLNSSFVDSVCNLDLYYPAAMKDYPTVVWLHGGGLSGGEKEIPHALRNHGMAVVGVGYRLAPDASAPEYIQDAAAAVAWTFKNISSFGGDPKKIIVSGYSAGAYLAAMVGLDSTWLEPHHINVNDLAGIVSLSGQMITHFQIRKEMGIPETQPVIDKFAPLFHVSSDRPPLLLITGDRELELFGRYEENAYMQRMMKLSGHKQTRLIEISGYTHDMTAPAFPHLLEEVRRICDTAGK